MKKSLKTELTKEKILKAAVEEFGKHGYDGATVNRICQKHSISKGLVYHNFESKDQLYLCCVDEAVNEFISYMQKFDFNADFKFYMKERYKFFEKNPYYSRLIFSFILTDNKDFSKMNEKIKNKFDEFNRKVYINSLKKLKLRDGITQEEALQYHSLLQNMLNSYQSTETALKKDFNLIVSNHEKSLEKILDFILYGIAEKND